MGGNLQQHLDSFGVCQCGRQSSGVEMMRLESQDEWGRWSYSNVPACADCFGLI